MHTTYAFVKGHLKMRQMSVSKEKGDKLDIIINDILVGWIKIILNVLTNWIPVIT